MERKNMVHPIKNEKIEKYIKRPLTRKERIMGVGWEKKREKNIETPTSVSTPEENEKMVKTPSVFVNKYVKKQIVDFDVVICIPSHERYEKVKRLITQFYEQPTKYSIKIVLLNDGSKDNRYDNLVEEFPEIIYLKNEKPNGKVLHWYCYNQLWEYLKNVKSHTILQMDDDFIICDGFLDNIISLFFELKLRDNKILAISPHLWSFKKTSKRESWWSRVDFVDGIALIEYNLIKSINYELQPVDATEVCKVGVPVRAWTQIGDSIKKMKGKIYRTKESWVYHDGNDDSKLHSDFRKDGKCGVYTQKYIGNLFPDDPDEPLIPDDPIKLLGPSDPIKSSTSVNTTSIISQKPTITSSISIVLNVYKRPQILEKQIEAIKNQSIRVNSEDIHIWYNKSDVQQNLPTDKDIKTYVCNWNTKFFGRFTLPLLIKTQYVAMFDDDTIPQRDWLKNCLETIEKPETNGILGGSGVLLKEKKYHPFASKVGWNGTHSNKTERVDLVGHAWFFRQDWSKYIWYEKPYTWDNGEDIMFSYLAQKYGGINTFVPPHPEHNKQLWCNDFKIGIEIGNDKNASFKLDNHKQMRDNVCIYCINNGWDTVNKIK